MKKSFIISFAFLLFTTSLFAAEIEIEGTPMRKFQRGLLDIALSPIELSHELAKEKKVDSVIPSWFSGLGRGSCFMVGRVLGGVYEILTFPVPLPANYSPVIVPEYAWEHLPESKVAKTS